MSEWGLYLAMLGAGAVTGYYWAQYEQRLARRRAQGYDPLREGDDPD